MSNQSRRQFGTGSLRSKIEGTFAGVVFASTALFYVGGTIAMFLENAPLVA